MPPTYGFQGNLVPGWSFESPAAGPPNADWNEWVETEAAGGGVATVEAATDYVRFRTSGAAGYSLQLTITAAGDSADVTSANFITIDKTRHYVLRFNHYRVTGGNGCTVTIKQYNAGNVDQADDITITPAGSAAWGLSQTVIHAAGEGGNDWNANCAKVKLIIKVTGTVSDWRIDGVSLAGPFDGGKLSAFGSQVFVNGMAIGDLTGIGFSASGDIIDVSSHDSTDMFREKTAGMRDGGTIPIEGNLDLSDVGQVDYHDHYNDGVAQTFLIVFPYAAAEFAVSGMPNNFDISAPYDDKLSWSGEVVISGKPTYSEATF